jgi:hypothetical protein
MSIKAASKLTFISKLLLGLSAHKNLQNFLPAAGSTRLYFFWSIIHPQLKLPSFLHSVSNDQPHVKKHIVKPWFTVPRFTVSLDLLGLIPFPQNFSTKFLLDHRIMCQSSWSPKRHNCKLLLLFTPSHSVTTCLKLPCQWIPVLDTNLPCNLLVQFAHTSYYVLHTTKSFRWSQWFKAQYKCN